MPVPIPGHVPDFYIVGSAVLALLFCAAKVLNGAVRETLDTLRDMRRYRREKDPKP